MNAVKSYALPTITDAEGDTVTVSTYLSGDINLPSFMTYNSATKTYLIAPTTFAQVASYTIAVALSDGTNNPVSAFTVTVTNTAPKFSSAP
jgi:hypothetical protein